MMESPFVRMSVLIWVLLSNLAMTSEWVTPQGGDWFEAQNWNGEVPNEIDSQAILGRSLFDPNGLIDISSPVVVGSLVLDNLAPISIVGEAILFQASDSRPVVHFLESSAGVELSSGLMTAAENVLELRIQSPIATFSNLLNTSEMDEMQKTGGGILQFTGAESGWHGNLTHREGILLVSGNVLGDRLELAGGELNGNGQLELEELIIRQGTIDMRDAVVSAAVRKEGWNYSLVSSIGRNSVVDTSVNAGLLQVSNSSGLGRGGEVDVAARHAILLDTGGVQQNVRLNDSTGFAYKGGYQINTPWAESIEAFSGTGIVGVNRNRPVNLRAFRGTGNIHLDEGRINLYADESELSGIVSLGSGTAMSLNKEGRLDTVAAIALGSYATLYLDNSAVNLPDRLGDAIPVEMRGGSIEYWVSNEGSSEQLGTIKVLQGANRIRSKGNGLSIHSIEGAGTAVIDIGSAPVHITAAPEMAWGMLPAWILSDGEFSSVNNDGQIVPLRLAAPLSEDWSTADSSTHLGLISTPVNADRDLRVASVWSQQSDFDLGGHLLSVETGGIAVRYGVTLTNGRITSGNDALFLYQFEGDGVDTPLRIEADIVDDHDHPIDVVLTGSHVLSGHNSYSGMTVLNGGNTVFEVPQAIPAQNSMEVNGTHVYFAFTDSAPVVLDELHVSSGRLRGDVDFQANAYRLESGTVAVNLIGDGHITKTTRGRVSLSGNNSAFSGDIDIYDGLLFAGNATSTVAGVRELGTGVVRIHEKGILVNASHRRDLKQYLIDADLELLGGELVIHRDAGIDPWVFHGQMKVLEDSHFSIYDANEGRPVAYSGREFVVTADLFLADQVTTHMSGDGTFRLQGETTVGGVAGIYCLDAALEIGGVVIAGASDTELNVNLERCELTNAFSLHVPANNTFSLRENGDTFRPVQISSSRFVSGSGTVANDLEILDNGILQPGGANTIGQLTVEGLAVLGPRGRLQLDLDQLVHSGDALQADHIVLSATEDAPFLISVNASQPDSFLPTEQGQWTILLSQSLQGFDARSIVVDSSQLRQTHDLPANSTFELVLTGTNVDLLYRPNLRLMGDFDDNMVLDAQDIDALSRAIRLGEFRPLMDLSGDGLLDQHDRIRWIEQAMSSYWGDSNLDGEFGSADLVIVFQAGLYEDAITGNATWASGDWNGDGDFDSSDLVLAFTSNGYEQGPRALSAVPEPSASLALLPLVLVGAVWMRHRSVPSTRPT